MSGIVRFENTNRKPQKEYFSGKDALNLVIDEIYEVIGSDQNIVLVADLLENKYFDKKVDLKVANVYYFDGEHLVRLEGCKIKPIYNVFTSNKRGFNAILVKKNDDAEAPDLRYRYCVDDEFTKKIVTKEYDGKFGKFTAAFIPTSQIDEMSTSEEL